MNFLMRILLKGLALIYFIMAVIGFLGFYGIGEYPPKIFSFFYDVFGKYSIAIPILCLIFMIICVVSSRKNLFAEDEVDYYESEYDLLEEERGSASIPTRRRNRREENTFAGFNNYFRGEPLISKPKVNEDRFKKLGTDFSTYFGQGEHNIYFPRETRKLNGFKDYFAEQDLVATNYSKAVNETLVGKESFAVYPQPKKEIPKPEVFSKYYEQPKPFAREEKEKPTKVGSSKDNIEPGEEKKSPGETLVQRWQLPKIDFLTPHQPRKLELEEDNSDLLEEVLSTFGVSAKVINVSFGPVITRYELSPAPGTKISRIVNLADDIALALASKGIRIEAPIPGKAAVGIEIPRAKPETVFFREVIDTDLFRNCKAKLRVALGKDIANAPAVCKLEKTPHLLIAGATGSGKSIFINCLINSLLYTVTPDEVRLLMIDPKLVELSQYNGIPHLLAPVVTDPKKASKYLNYLVKEMENRYELFAASGVRDIEAYNSEFKEKLPYIVVIIDELADLMMVAANEVEEAICRLAQMARAAGIHLVIATQRPSVNIITGLIKANIPSRISFAVSSQIDSRTILDTVGAEKLLGKGDMLYAPLGLNKPVRIHGCYIDEAEVKAVIEHWKRQGQPPDILNEEQVEEQVLTETKVEELDDKFIEAGELVITSKVASVSFLQRRLRVGYSRAARLMDMLEEAGVVGAYEGNKPRDILMTLEDFQNKFGI